MGKVTCMEGDREGRSSISSAGGEENGSCPCFVAEGGIALVVLAPRDGGLVPGEDTPLP